MDSSRRDKAKRRPFHRRAGVRDAAVTAITWLAIVALGLTAWRLAPLILLVFGGALVAIFLRALAEATANWTRLSYRWSLAIIVIALVVTGMAGVFLGGQLIGTQMAELAEQVPKSLDKLREDIAQYPWGKRLIKAAPKSAEEIPVQQGEAVSYASGALYSLTGVFAAMLVVLFLAIYMAVDPGKYVAGALRLFPVGRRERVREVLGQIHQTLRWWLLGKIVSMAIIGLLTSTGLAMLGVPLAAALGVIAALLTFVPNFGPVISAVPAVLLGFVQSPMTAAYVVVLYLALQTVESYLITPVIQQRTVSLPPALTITAQIGMGMLFGVGGVVLATPMAAAALVAITRLYVEDSLEKHS
jgi:predicted PurR-regulated permease PerM